MTETTIQPFAFPAVLTKKITAAFDGGRLSSDGGLMLLREVERRLGIAERLAALMPDRRDPKRVTHRLADMIRARLFAIAHGYEDCNDFDRLRSDPVFKLACGRLPDSGADLASQPTLSRLENTPSLRDAIRLTYALVDQWIASYARAPEGVTLDIDDTCDVVHGRQQLSFFHAHYDEYCFLPIHVYDTATGRPVAMVLRPGKTPSGVEVRGHLRRLVRRIRASWPAPRITFRGDSHYARPEAMDFLDANGIQYIFGLSGTRPLTAKVREAADAVATTRAVEQAPVIRDHAEVRHKAHGWKRERRAIARIEATPLGLDIRFVVTNLTAVAPRVVYEDLYCARGQAENLIKAHKAHLASDRTSCRRAVANQVRIVLHTAAYWLLLGLRDAIPATPDLAKAEFATIRLRLLKIAVRVTETKSRIRLAFAAAYPNADLFHGLVAAFTPKPNEPMTQASGP
jgi:hypothetical protein